MQMTNLRLTDSAVSLSEAIHLHVMNIHEQEPKSCRSSPPTSSTTLEQWEAGAPGHFFHQNRLTAFIAISDHCKINEKTMQ